MKKNTLQSLTAAATKAAQDSRSVAVSKLAAPPVAAAAPMPAADKSASAHSNGSATTDRKRMNLYYTDQDDAIIKELRAVIVLAGEKSSDNGLILTALRAVNLKDKERLVEIYRTVQADDRRRK